VVAGGAAGYLISVSGYGLFGAALVLGFFVAALSAAFAPRRRLAFGLLGNGITIAVCLVSVTINNWLEGRPLAAEFFLYFVPTIIGVVTVPGLAGVGIVAAVAAATRPAA
jgi:hypothetical protein